MCPSVLFPSELYIPVLVLLDDKKMHIKTLRLQSTFCPIHLNQTRELENVVNKQLRLHNTSLLANATKSLILNAFFSNSFEKVTENAGIMHN